ncbi:PP2C family protein-serine/threonine phosphatase [Parvibium lacunae]|uniref:Serine/threonine-protein phosphatase n=1 Tax=Parvibium lacunae TaxID=1888893 RepID=A0A368L8C7_9BURK|nr:PP2C family serine/threonine-protein phosphatase [Parvibium lacunae]RCS59489.1 serine/threonine-protein phosphatase [Parvibium lacunae]
MKFSIYQESKLGTRQVNQDRMGFSYSRDCLMMVVADGMGGHANGEIAAQITLQAIAGMFQQRARPVIKDTAKFLEDAINAAHKEIHRFRAVNQLPEAPRTTVVVCVVQDGCAHWAHAGDSRLYLMREGEVLIRTKDHTKVQRLVDEGYISQEQAYLHPERNKVMNCLGSPMEPRVEIGKVEALHKGDVLLLCTDGLWAAIHDQELARAFMNNQVTESLPDVLEHAVQRSGRSADNATGIAMMWEGKEEVEARSHRRSTHSTKRMPNGAFTTTIRAPRFADFEDSIPLSEEDIENAIDEINDALNRSKNAMNNKE